MQKPNSPAQQPLEVGMLSFVHILRMSTHRDLVMLTNLPEMAQVPVDRTWIKT